MPNRPSARATIWYFVIVYKTYVCQILLTRIHYNTLLRSALSHIVLQKLTTHIMPVLKNSCVLVIFDTPALLVYMI